MAGPEAYLAMQQHRHQWSPLPAEGDTALEFCPDCGAARRAPEPDTE